jgi:hypothetical protein
VADVLLDDAQECIPIRVRRLDVNFHESRSKVRGEVLLAYVGSGIHTSEDTEIWMAGDGL